MPAEIKGAKVLVTGASGMLGRELCKQWSPQYEVVGVSKSGRLNTRASDLSEESQVKSLFVSVKPDLVIHSAAYSDVDGCEKDPILAHSANAISTKNLSALCGLGGVPFVYVSTDYVFDGQKKSLYEETDTTAPANIYGMTKLEGEYFTRNCAASSAIVRTSWLFGAGNPNSFVNAIAVRLKNESSISILDDQQDSPTCVKDLSGAIADIGGLLLEAKKHGKIRHEVFQVCNHGITTRYRMTLKIKEYLGFSKTQVGITDKNQIQNRAAIRPSYAAMSTRRYEECFGKKMRPWEEALEEYVKSIQ